MVNWKPISEFSPKPWAKYLVYKVSKYDVATVYYDPIHDTIAGIWHTIYNKEDINYYDYFAKLELPEK